MELRPYPYGSKVISGDSLIRDGAAQVEFIRVGRVAECDKNTWIELIYYLPRGNLVGVTSMRITYQCSADLIIKLSQSDFGENGDGGYAHYQSLLPAAKTRAQQ